MPAKHKGKPVEVIAALLNVPVDELKTRRFAITKAWTPVYLWQGNLYCEQPREPRALLGQVWKRIQGTNVWVTSAPR